MPTFIVWELKADLSGVIKHDFTRFLSARKRYEDIQNAGLIAMTDAVPHGTCCDQPFMVQSQSCTEPAKYEVQWLRFCPKHLKESGRSLMP